MWLKTIHLRPFSKMMFVQGLGKLRNHFIQKTWLKIYWNRLITCKFISKTSNWYLFVLTMKEYLRKDISQMKQSQVVSNLKQLSLASWRKFLLCKKVNLVRYLLSMRNQSTWNSLYQTSKRKIKIVPASKWFQNRQIKEMVETTLILKIYQWNWPKNFTWDSSRSNL